MRRIQVVLGLIGGMLGVLLSGGLGPVHAQFTVYDEFLPGAIDPLKWSPDLAVNRRVFEISRRITPEGHLLKGVRVYGETLQDTGVVASRNRLRFTASNLAAIQFEAALDYQMTGCPVPGATPSEVMAQLRAVLFNDGTSLGAGDLTGEVEAEVKIFRRSDSTYAPEVLEVQGIVSRCGDPGCTLHEVIGVAFLGQVLVKEFHTYRLQWDILSGQVIFQKDADPPLGVPLGLPIGEMRDDRLLVTRSSAANCTVSPQPFAEVNVLYDNILVILFPF